jgi:cbb3-type cytochrome oxidase maturation protein
LALILALVFIGIFIYSVKIGQYDDLETPSYKMLIEDENINQKEKENQNLKEKMYE